MLPRRWHTLAGGLWSQGAGWKMSALSSHSFSAHASQTRWVHWETGLQLEKDSSLWFLYNVVSTQLHSNKSLVSSYGEWKERWVAAKQEKAAQHGRWHRECSNTSIPCTRHVSWAARLRTREFPSIIPEHHSKISSPFHLLQPPQFWVSSLSTATQSMVLPDIRFIARGSRSTHEMWTQATLPREWYPEGTGSWLSCQLLFDSFSPWSKVTWLDFFYLASGSPAEVDSALLSQH